MLRPLGALVLSGIILGAAACADRTFDTSVAPALDAARHGSAATPNGQVAFRCVLGLKDPDTGHWQRRPATIYFPRPETTPDEPLLPYRYEVVSNAGELVRFANCAIPRSEAAIRRMDHAVRVGSPGVERVVVASPLQSDCYTYSCPIEGIIVKATPVPELEPADDWDWNWESPDSCAPAFLCGGGGGGGGGGGDGGRTPPDSTEEDCYASSDPNCLQPLRSADSSAIRTALANYRRSPTEFTDSIAQRECTEMYDRFQQMFADGDIYRGLYDSPDSTGHYGTYFRGSIHFDPQWLVDAAGGDTVALKEIAVTAYHEAAHALSYNHGNPTWVGSVDIYTESYFNRLTPGANSCVKR